MAELKLTLNEDLSPITSFSKKPMTQSSETNTFSKKQSHSRNVKIEEGKKLPTFVIKLDNLVNKSQT